MYTISDIFMPVKVSSLGIRDFVKYAPITENQEKFKQEIIGVISKGIKDFWHPKFDPAFCNFRTEISFSSKWHKKQQEKMLEQKYIHPINSEICYAPNKRPAIGKNYEWWNANAKDFWPDRSSRLGTKDEYIAFLGFILKKLILSGWNVNAAWYAICDDSRALGHYWDSPNAQKDDFERTGKREICGFCDLGNTMKILAPNCEEDDGIWIAGGCYYDEGKYNPLADLFCFISPTIYHPEGVGWIILEE